MLFFAAGDHGAAGLPHDPLKALVAPRPIGWISAVSARGEINLAPYSFFNAFSGRPPIVGFASEGRKDAMSFVEETGAFTCNMVSLDLADRMNVTSVPFASGDNEFLRAGLTMVPGRIVPAPRVGEAPAALECRHLQTIALRDLEGQVLDRHLVLGQVVGIHIAEAFIVDGKVDTGAMRLLARCGYDDYAVADRMFALPRPEVVPA